MAHKLGLFGSWIIGAALLASVPLAHAKEWSTVNIATEGTYEPWNVTLPGGKISGFEPELIGILCERMKLTCNVVVQNWDGMIASLNAGKFDMLMDAIVVTEERKKVIAFSIPYARTPASFIALDASLLPGQTGAANEITLGMDEEQIKRAVAPLREALKGKTIGIASGTLYTQFLDDHFKDIATLREYNASADTLLDLQAGRIDVAFDDVTFLDALKAKPEGKDLAYTGPQIGGPIWGEGEALAFRHKDADLKAMFDAALQQAMADGTVKRLSEKWFKLDLTPKA